MIFDKRNLSLVMACIIALSIASSVHGQTRIDVSLQIRSGAQNPGWIIQDASEISALLSFIDGLPAVPQTDFPPFGSFLLVSTDAGANFPKSIAISTGVVRVQRYDNSIAYYRDTKNLRGFLVNAASTHNIAVPLAIRGDLDGNGVVDIDDVNLLLSDKDKPVGQSKCGARCDFDGDGVITALDARKLTSICTKLRCAK